MLGAKKEMRILMVGLDAAGKSYPFRISNWLSLEGFVRTSAIFDAMVCLMEAISARKLSKLVVCTVNGLVKSH